MEIFKNISNQFINLNEIMSNQNYVDFDVVKEKIGWIDCPIMSLETSPSRNYIVANLPKDERVCFDKFATSKLWRIENELFDGCFCLVEQSNGYCPLTRIDIITTKNKVLTLLESRSIMSVIDIDEALEYKNIVLRTAKMLHTFDVSKKYQNYQFFCEKLPERCWRDRNFAIDVLTAFETMGDMEIVGVEDIKYVNVKECKKDTRKFFISYLSKYAEFDDLQKINGIKDDKQDRIIS